MHVDRLMKLCTAAAAISPHAEIHMTPNPDVPMQWAISILVGDVIVATSSFGPVEQSLEELIRSLGSISTRMMKALRPEDYPKEE